MFSILTCDSSVDSIGFIAIQGLRVHFHKKAVTTAFANSDLLEYPVCSAANGDDCGASSVLCKACYAPCGCFHCCSTSQALEQSFVCLHLRVTSSIQESSAQLNH